MNTLLSRHYFSLLLLSITFLSSCGEDDPEKMTLPADEPGTVSAKIDGVFFRSNGPFSVSSNFRTDLDQVGDYRLDIAAEAEENGIEQRITFSIWGMDFDSVKAGDSYSAGDEVGYGGNRFDGDFYRRGRGAGLGDIDDITDSEQTAASSCSITAIDHGNRIISGTFKFKAIDIFGSGLTFEITEGKFTEIHF